MKPEQDFSPERVKPADHQESYIFPFASDDYINARQLQAKLEHQPPQTEGVKEMLQGFTLAENTVKHTRPEAAKASEQPRANQPEVSHEDKECKIAYATRYKPTGNQTADQSTYTSKNGLVAAAVDLKEPIGNARLGTILTITNLSEGSDHKTIDVRVRDKGGFGQLPTPEFDQGIKRGVDLTMKAAQLLGSGDMTKVEVCWPVKPKPKW